ncbi:hypothetical protein HGM15179_011588 [Zosterops borbonicus]|uniref:Uncharacterized protein n=1 Tax=Zosterops borbonicus TaxID=364589 RepID=A0A8K1GCA7_9PASS|nr:hypothetical protein HGM15179_011588 [Zosterops borbonicus]
MPQAPPTHFGSHTSSSGSHAWDPEDKELDSGSESPHIPSLALVTYQRTRGTSITMTDQQVPFRLALVSPLWIRDHDWHTAKVARNRGTWHLIGTEYVVMGDCKYTPPETEIAPEKMASDPEWFVLWLHFTRPPIFLAKGQIIAQLIPTPKERETNNTNPQVNTVITIMENRPEE